MKNRYYVATRSFEFRDSFRGDEEIIAGMTQVSEEAECFQAHPENFAPLRDRESTGLRQLAQMAARGEVSPAALRAAGVATESTNDQFVANRPSRGSSDPARDAAMRAVEARAKELSAPAGDRLVAVINRDSAGADRGYIEAALEPAYERGFGKLVMASLNQIPAVLEPDEQRAVSEMSRAMTMQRAMSVGSGSGGGYAVPLTIDPTVILTSNGSVNPLRDVATVTPILSTEWQGITSAGITASFDAELAEVSDDTPSVGDPTVKAEKAQAFAEFSIEVSQDWPSLQQELVAMLTDAKDNLEATKFALGAGSGSNEPEGLVAGLDSGSHIETAASLTIASADFFGLQTALPPRFQPNASWLMALGTLNRVRQFDPNNANMYFSADQALLLAKPWHEISAMSAAATAGAKIAVYGDVAQAFRIVDRIGMQIELVPHIFGENRRPTGKRGLYAYWRTGSGVVNDSAVRLLKVKA